MTYLKRLKQTWYSLLGFRHSGILLLCFMYASICLLLRLGLLARSWQSVRLDLSLLVIMPLGFLFDMLMILIMLLPVSLALVFVPKWWSRSTLGKGSFHLLFVVVLGFSVLGAVSEWVFWSEFDCRFNFIAVDYLVYTYEVIENIKQSYPLPLIMSCVVLVTLTLYAGFLRLGFMKHWLNASGNIEAGWGQRFAGLAICALPLTLGLLSAFVVGRQTAPGTAPGESLVAGLRQMEMVSPSFHNSYTKEIAKNGQYAIVAAFFSNVLEFERFYPVMGDRIDHKQPPLAAFKHLRTLLKEENATFLSQQPMELARRITNPGEALKLNVIQITIESMSFEYMGRYQYGESDHPAKNLTPHLDALSKQSVFFNHVYASGTRTVRGMESLALSMPPIPGQSILRRARNERLFSLPGLFQKNGYDSVFLYGGDGYFDNMNYFFSHNGCRIVDRPVKEAEGAQPRFANAWGVCDEDLFDWVIDEADKAYAARQPFYHFVMTTSNHRPFTWPEGKTKNPLGTIEGAVEYTDLAIQGLIESARNKPWFKDTVFVIVADHDMKVAGKQELAVKKYEIPMMFYSPAHFEPRQVETLCSQLDYAPTLMGLLNWSYDSRFLGRDQSRPQDLRQRAFISNYQKVGYIVHEGEDENDLVVLMPTRREKEFDCKLGTGKLTLQRDADSSEGRDWDEEDCIAYYQCADWLFSKGLYTQETSN